VENTTGNHSLPEIPKWKLKTETDIHNVNNNFDEGNFYNGKRILCNGERNLANHHVALWSLTPSVFQAFESQN
jgi:hypothetical protein